MTTVVCCLSALPCGVVDYARSPVPVRWHAGGAALVGRPLACVTAADTGMHPLDTMVRV